MCQKGDLFSQNHRQLAGSQLLGRDLQQLGIHCCLTLGITALSHQRHWAQQAAKQKEDNLAVAEISIYFTNYNRKTQKTQKNLDLHQQEAQNYICKQL